MTRGTRFVKRLGVKTSIDGHAMWRAEASLKHDESALRLAEVADNPVTDELIGCFDHLDLRAQVTDGARL